MTRHVFDSDMVIHVWAQQTQASGRNAKRSVSFEGPTLRSYHEPIAEFYTTVNGDKRALVTSNTFSVTTTRHVRCARSSLASWHHVVPNIRDWRGFRYGIGSDENLAAMHAANLAWMVAQYQEAMPRLRRKQSPYCSAVESLEDLTRPINRYCRDFGLVEPVLDYQADGAAIDAHHAAKAARLATPAHQAKLAKAKERREAKRALADAADAERRAVAYAEWLAGEPERQRIAAERAAVWAAGEPERQRIAAEAAQRRIAERAAALDAWRNGGRSIGYSANFYTENRGAYLRVNGEEVQTSLGASVPLTHAVRVFKFVKLCRERGQPWHRNGQQIRVGHFNLDSIDASGNFKAGCHYVEWSESERIARQLGILDDAPSADVVSTTESNAH